MAINNIVKGTASCSIMFTVVGAVGWIIFLGGFASNDTPNKVRFLGGFGPTNSPNPSSDLGSIPYYFTAVVYPVLAILLIGAAIQVLVAPKYKIVQAILMSFIVLFEITAAIHGGTILNALALPTGVSQPANIAMLWGVAIETAGLIFSLLFLIEANIYFRD